MTTAQELVERALSLAKADGCVVIVDEVTSANLRWANNTLTTNGMARSRDLTVISIVAGATGVISRQGVTADSLEEVVRAAENTATNARKAEDHHDLVPADESIGDWDAPPSETSIDVFAGFAPALGAAFQEAGGHDRLLFGFASHEMHTTYLGTSSGLRARHDQPTGHVEINGKSKDFARTAWVGAPAANMAEVNVEAMVSELGRRLAWSSRKIDLPPGRYDTILPPSAVADLMINLYWSTVARNAHDGRTVFARPGGGTRVGDRLTDVPVTLRSDPAAPGIECSPTLVAHQSSAALSVFDNGTMLHPTEWISSGVLTSLVQTRHSTELTGLPFTPYIDNLVMSSGPPGSQPGDLLAGVEFGLLLTCLWYIREVDPQTLLLTGLTRDGVYLVQRGEVTGEVNNFRFNESPVDLLRRIAHSGEAVRTLPREWCDYFTRTVMPALHVTDFNMSSVSQAS